MSVNVHITHINDLFSGLQSDLDEHQSGIRTDNNVHGFKSWCYNDGTGVKECACLGEDADFADLSISEYINHSGDANTYIQYQNDNISFYVGGNLVLDLLPGTSLHIPQRAAAPDAPTTGAEVYILDTNPSVVLIKFADGTVGEIAVGYIE